jgi:hypothetical protein
MEEIGHTKKQTEKAWWHWLVFGLFTPFFRARGFRDLSKRESIGLIALSIVVLILVTLGMLGYLHKW